MEDNITLSLEVEDEDDLKPAGRRAADEPLFAANWFKVTEQIGQSYLLRIRVAAYDDALDLAALIGRRVRLTVSRTLSADGQLHSRGFAGVIWSAQQRGRYKGAPEGTMYVYWLDVRPALHALAMTTRSRVYGSEVSPRSIPDVIQYCLTGSYPSASAATTTDTIKSNIDYETVYENESDYEIDSMMQKTLIQYNESDLNFMKRLMERWGIFFFFDTSGTADDEGFGQNLLISDTNQSFKYCGGAEDLDDAAALYYVDPPKFSPGSTFLVKNFVARRSLRSKTLSLRDYYYGNASATLTENYDLDESGGEGEATLWGQNFTSTSTESDGEILALRSAELLMSDQCYFTGKSDCFELAPGFIFRLEDHFRSSYNTGSSNSDYAYGFLVTEVAHECSVPWPGQDWDDGTYGYSADFTAIDAETTYRSPKVTAIPKVSGVISASVDSADQAERADLDDQGRYLVRFKFDEADKSDGSCSARLRMSQPYGGSSGNGFLFPLVKDVEVLVAFVNGDIDRPVIMGAVPNSTHASPTYDQYETRNCLLTNSEVTLEIEDGTPYTSTAAVVVASPPDGLAEDAEDAEVVTKSRGGDAPGRAARAAGDDDTATLVDNWARLFLSHNGEKSYLRIGAVPDSESETHMSSIGGQSLPEDSGWLDYTEGDRACGTTLDKTELVGGTETHTVAGDYTLVCSDGIQAVFSGDPETLIEGIGETLEAGDQALAAIGNQHVYAGGDQYQEVGGDQVYQVSGDMRGRVKGHNKITYEKDNETDVYGRSITTFHGFKQTTLLQPNVDRFFATKIMFVAGYNLAFTAGVDQGGSLVHFENHMLCNYSYSTLSMGVRVFEIDQNEIGIRRNPLALESTTAKVLNGLMMFA